MMPSSQFIRQARYISTVPVAVRASELGGYGPDGEVIYEAHPEGTPGVLSDSVAGASAHFASNGSVSFTVTRPDGQQIEVLSESFDRLEKRETGVLSGNVWLDLTPTGRRGQRGRRRVASLVNPSIETNLPPASLRIVKVQRDPREIFYCTSFGKAGGESVTSVVRMALRLTPAGPMLARDVFIQNHENKPLSGSLWAFFDLHGTQFQPYDMEIWYDMGMPLSLTETVVACSVPYSDAVQIKRVSSRTTEGLRPVAATCNYRSFVGDTGKFTLLPDAVKQGELLSQHAGKDLSRFSVPTIAANQYRLSVPARASTALHQSLLYVTDEAIVQRFRRETSASTPGYSHLQEAFANASRTLIRQVSHARPIRRRRERSQSPGTECFRLSLPAAPAIGEFLNSIAGSATALYGRSFGRRIADGVELPFRDRCQDMWPMLKIDPARIRQDLVHTFGFIYHTAPNAVTKPGRHLTLMEKVHGGAPRQYPSFWGDRTQTITNDNRLYSDSAIWLLDSLVAYLRETGDSTILAERVGTIEFADPDDLSRGIRGGSASRRIADAAAEILARYERLCADSPYGMVQILHGDWCDPVDMLGTDRIGDASRRGMGRGATVRLSAHVFLSTLAAIEMFECPSTATALGGDFRAVVTRLQGFANRLRQSVLEFGWEDTVEGPGCGFIDSIHELRADGSIPNPRRGEVGYTLGSMRPELEFDGVPRRTLTSTAFGLGMLMADRPFLDPVPDLASKVRGLLKTADELLYDPEVGLRLYSTALANDQVTRRLVGRMGIIPSGCAENGEYHHAQAMMHRFRIDVPGEQDTTWAQLGRILSVTRGARLLGPFDSMANSYASDANDPHFGAGMIFGFSGSADWIIGVVERMVGLELNLMDEHEPALRIRPRLPRQLGDRLTFERVIHHYAGNGQYHRIPLRVRFQPAGRCAAPRYRINGRTVKEASIHRLDGLKRIDIEITVPARQAGQRSPTQRKTECRPEKTLS